MNAWYMVSLITHLIALLVNGYYVVQEIRKGIYGQAKYKASCLRGTCITTLLIGSLYPLCYLVLLCEVEAIRLDESDGICTITVLTVLALQTTQPIFAGLFELSRLYQLNQLSKSIGFKGYPTSMFTFMLVVAVISLIATLQANRVIINTMDHYNIINNAAKWIVQVYPLWELTMLCLFLYQIHGFTKSQKSTDLKNDIRRTRIQQNMIRVTLLTVFYLTFAFIVIGIAQFHLWQNDGSYIDFMTDHPYFYVFVGLQIMATSVAMYLMQTHNGEAYKSFVQVLSVLHLNLCCCCCRNALEEQYLFFKGDATQREKEQRLLAMDSMTCTAVNEFDMDEPPEYEAPKIHQ